MKEEVVDLIEQAIDKEVMITEKEEEEEEEEKEKKEEEKTVVVIEKEKDVEPVVDKVEEEEEEEQKEEEENVEEKEQVIEVQAKVHVDATIIEEKELKSEVEEKEQIVMEDVSAATIPAAVTRKPTARRLNQVEAVVLPGNQAAPLSSVNVQFGSLNLSNGEESVTVAVAVEQPEEVNESEPVIEKKETKVIENVVEKEIPIANQAQPQTQQLNTATTTTVNAGGLVGFNNKPAMVPLNQQQQPQQETPYMMNPYSATYNHMNTISNGYNGMVPTEYAMYNNTIDVQSQQPAQQQRMVIVLDNTFMHNY